MDHNKKHKNKKVKNKKSILINRCYEKEKETIIELEHNQNTNMQNRLKHKSINLDITFFCFNI